MGGKGKEKETRVRGVLAWTLPTPSWEGMKSHAAAAARRESEGGVPQLPACLLVQKATVTFSPSREGQVNSPPTLTRQNQESQTA